MEKKFMTEQEKIENLLNVIQNLHRTMRKDENFELAAGFKQQYLDPEPYKLTVEELKELRNNDFRKEFLKDYQKWGIWFEESHIKERFYRCQMPNGDMLIISEEHQYGRKKPIFGVSTTLYLDTRDHTTFSSCRISDFGAVEYLKELKKLY